MKPHSNCEKRIERERVNRDHYEDLYNRERRVTSNLLTATESLGFRIKELEKERASLQRRVEAAEAELWEINNERSEKEN